MQAPQPKVLFTLEEVHTHFQHWRQTRQFNNERIPHALWSEVASLIGRYRKVDILRRLGLNNGQLKSMLPSQTPLTPPSDRAFIEVPVPSIPTCYAELRHPNGMTLRLQSIPEQQFLNLVQSFMTNNSCCK